MWGCGWIWRFSRPFASTEGAEAVCPRKPATPCSVTKAIEELCDETPSKKRLHPTTSDGQDSLVRASPTRGNHAGPASGPQGTLDPGEKTLRTPPGSEGHLQRKVRIRLSEVKKALSAHVSGWNCFDQVCLMTHEKERELSVRTTLLCVVDSLAITGESCPVLFF